MKILNQLFKKIRRNVPTNELQEAESVPAQTDLTNILCHTWQKLDANILEPFLDEDFKYNSVWVGSTLNGKENYLQYLRGKFETFMKYNCRPVFDVVNEYGISLPHFRQENVEGVLDYNKKNGKITNILMRPLIRIKVVDQQEWGSYAQAYNEFLPQAVQIAGQAIQDYANERGLEYPHFAWLQMHLNHPSFQHLCFRKGAQVYSISPLRMEKMIIV